MARKKITRDATTDGLLFDPDAAPAGEAEASPAAADADAAAADGAAAPDEARPAAASASDDAAACADAAAPADAAACADAAAPDAAAPDDAARPDIHAHAATEPETDAAEVHAPDSGVHAPDPHAPDPDPHAHSEPDEAARLRAERDQWRDRHLRLAADFDNYRKRSDERMRTRWERAQADLVSRLLDPMDDLLRISELGPETSAAADAVLEGAALVERKFFRILEEVGVEVVDPQGEPFDPNVMEAMMRAPADSEEEDDVVERVFQKGYVLKGQLLRPARVSVYKAG